MMTRLSSWSILNPIPTIVLFLILAIAGLAGFLSLRINNFPDVDIPAVTVTVGQPGSAPAEMETQVARLVENAVAGLGSVKHVRSAVNDGISVTTVEFALGTDTDRATNDVRNAVSTIRADLPADAEDPIIQRVDSAGEPLLIFIVRAPAMSPDQVSWFVDNDISKALLSISGVARVDREGGVDREIRIRLDPVRMAALGITAGGVSSQLRQVNANLPGGRMTLGAAEQLVRTLGSAPTVEALAATRVNLPDGRAVRLSDLGKVEDAWAEPRSRARLNGEELVAFSVTRTIGTSEVDVANKVRAKLAELDRGRPDVTLQEVTSAVDFVVESYKASREALLIGAALAVLVVWWFLRDTRATLISALAMPLSLLPTFAVMFLFHQSFNVVTLLALSLIVGILVDDAIVEIENIVRHMRQGKPPYEAALEAADEIGLAVVATTFTIVAVFTPVGFMPGVVGQFFKSFALAACVAVLFSLLVARMLTPLMAAYLLRKDRDRHDEPFWMQPYLRFLSWSLRHRIVALLGGIAIFIGSIALTQMLPSDFVPAGDRSRSVMSVELPPGATLEETDAVTQRIAQILRPHPEVSSVYVAIGTSAVTGFAQSQQGEVRRARVTVNLVPRGKRKLTQQQFEAKVRPELQAIPGVRLRFGADGNSGAKIQVTLASDDAAALATAVQRLERQMRAIPGLSNASSTASLARPEILITPKPGKAAELGVAAAAISQAARIATLGDVSASLPKFNLPDRQIPIRVMLAHEARDHLSTIRNLRVPAKDGASVPLSSVADISFGAGPSQIDRLDRRRSAVIEAEISGLTLGEATQLVQSLPAMRELPPGVFETPTGDTEFLAEMLTGFGTAFIAGILLMYIVLVLLFKGFSHPFTILMALPLSIGGAFGLLLVTGKAMSMPALIGLLMLMGIAAKNSILLVEYVLAEQARANVTRREALLEAAHKRARPIIMTTVAMAAGMLPIAVGWGADSEFRSPMAIAVIGGLMTSTLLSLVFVPVFFTFIDDLQAWIWRRAGKVFAPQTSNPVEVKAPAE